LAKARVVLHIPEMYHAKYDRVPHLALYPLVRDVVQGLGGEIVLSDQPSVLYRNNTLAGDGDLHIVEGGRVQGEGYLNAALAYLKGYWHLDPVGVLGESSILARSFDPATVSDAPAFFEALRQRFVVPRLSRYGQPTRLIAVPDGCIAVFLQGPAPFHRKLAYMSSAEMVRCVAKGAAGRPVVVKPHPLKRDEGLAIIEAAQDEGYDIRATEANVHDILAACAVTVSVNSAASIEGFLHGKPGILVGKSDFAQFMYTVRTAETFDEMLEAALSERIDYAAAITWYFQHQCLWIDGPDFPQRLLALFAAVGFDADRLGLRVA
jgi:hypothetical protein